MPRKPVVIILILSIVAVLAAACSGSPASSPGNPDSGAEIKSTGKVPDVVRATVIKPETVANGVVSIPVDSVLSKYNVHFDVPGPSGSLSFMAYQFDGKVYVRASICPPCRSQSFTLKKDRLVCDACGTVFDARTGAGVEGACVAYPKAAVAYQVGDGKMYMQTDDLQAAYLDTMKPG